METFFVTKVSGINFLLFTGFILLPADLFLNYL